MSRINASVLMSDAQNFSTEQQINPYYDASTLSLEQAVKEHTTIRECFEQAGIHIIQVPSPSDSQDGVYTANWALVRGDTAVLARLPNARKAEEVYAEKVLTELGKKVVRVPEGLKFSGQGDALPCGEYLFCGSGYRSDEGAQKFAAEQLGYTRVQLRTIPQLDTEGTPVINPTSGWADSFFYDIDLALAVIKGPSKGKKGLIAYCPEAFTPESRALLESFEGVDKIVVSLEEAQKAFATNLVSTGTSVIMSDGAPTLANELRSQGVEVITPHITELLKGGGYIRCVSLTLD